MHEQSACRAPLLSVLKQQCPLMWRPLLHGCTDAVLCKLNDCEVTLGSH